MNVGVRKDMRQKVKVSKIGGVIFLTILIWVWADLALERKLPLHTIPIGIETSNDPTLWVAFDVNDQYRSDLFIESIILKGPEATISEVDKIQRQIQFSILPEQHSLTESGSHLFPLLEFLQRQVSKDYGLAVESCEPDVLPVQVERLRESTVPVHCMDKDQIEVVGASVDPPTVVMFVPVLWEEEKRAAWVTLSDEEIKRASEQAIEKNPFIEIHGHRREATQFVRITTPPEDLQTGIVENPKLGYVISPTISNKYKVVIDDRNVNEAVKAFRVRATPAALQAYKMQRYHVLLTIADGDAHARETREITRVLRYDFPANYAGARQIRLDDNPVSVSFSLVPIAPSGEGLGLSKVSSFSGG